VSRRRKTDVEPILIRHWLNDLGFQSTAFVYVTTDGDGYGQFRISDCSRQIDLDIDHSNKAEYDNTRQKLVNLLDATVKVIDHIDEVATARGFK
jgi:hypothetical protein